MGINRENCEKYIGKRVEFLIFIPWLKHLKLPNPGKIKNYGTVLAFVSNQGPFDYFEIVIDGTHNCVRVPPDDVNGEVVTTVRKIGEDDE